VVRPDGFAVHRCSNCQMVYLADIPCAEDIDRLYRDYSTFKGLGPPRLARVRRVLDLVTKSDRCLSILERTGGVKGISVCEIGCSYGNFLRRARDRGARPFGVELDHCAREYMSRIGIPSTADLPQRQFAVICLLQVLEHVASPHEMLSRIAPALEPDGRLLISLPNAREYVKTGPAWVGFRVDLEHLNYFDLHSLSSILLPHALYVEQYWEHCQPELARRTAGHGYSLIGSRLRGALSRVLSRGCSEDGGVGAGSFVLTVLARKVLSDGA
jgi:2-polyprenyl-3-methyl-5-hydroxy-6-metoxy-1,4-benzoquinol methylase